MSYAKFGTSGTVESDTHGFTAEQLEYQDGFETALFPLKWLDNWRKDRPSFCAQTYGIGQSIDPTRNSLGRALDTVSMVEAEETTTPHMLATEPGVEPALGDKLTYTDGLIFTRKKVTITINGRGDLPVGFTEDQRGKTYEGDLLIMPAVGDQPIVSENGGLFINRVEKGESVTDWNKFTIELTKFYGNTPANAQTNMITPTLFTLQELQAVTPWFKITRTTTLNSKDKANVEESVDLYDASSST